MTSLETYIQFLETLNEASAIYTDKVIWMSPQYLKLLGYETLDELQGKSIYLGVHPDELIDQQKNIENRTKNHQNTSGTWNFRKKNGEYIKIHSKGSVITLENKTYLIAIARSHPEITHPEYTSSQIKHDTLTPLTTTKGYLELLETHITDPETHQLLEKAQKSLEKLHKNINKIIKETDQLNLIKKI
ncbi:MAG: PAS domain-containing protein [Candidatus Bathyarchaeota archaeon]|nr:PAS domain-containing protein [Candidatus Bathyarchaeota archaeon]